MKYRKKPVVIEAVQWTEDNFDDITELVSSNPDYYAVINGSVGLVVGTIEDAHNPVPVGHWIIKDVNGEVYPCKPDIFEATYEPADA